MNGFEIAAIILAIGISWAAIQWAESKKYLDEPEDDDVATLPGLVLSSPWGNGDRLTINGVGYVFRDGRFVPDKGDP